MGLTCTAVTSLRPWAPRNIFLICWVRTILQILRLLGYLILLFCQLVASFGYLTRGTYAQAYTTRAPLEVQERGIVWSGVDWSGAERSGGSVVGWSGVQWSAMEWGGVEWSGVEWKGNRVEMFVKRFVLIFGDFSKNGKIIIFRSFRVL